MTIRHFDYAAEGPRDMTACRECRGTGKVMLLVSTKPCKACGGTGKVVPAIPPEDLQDSARADSTRSPRADSASSPRASPPQAGSAGSPQASSPPGISLPPVVRRSYSYPNGEEEGGGAMVEMVEERVTGHWLTTTTFDVQDRVQSVTETFVPDTPEGLKT